MGATFGRPFLCLLFLRGAKWPKSSCQLAARYLFLTMEAIATKSGWLLGKYSQVSASTNIGTKQAAFSVCS